MANVEVVTRRYHTVNQATPAHQTGETYLVSDTLLGSLLVCDFAYPTEWSGFAPLATGATAGTPGTWTPAGARARYNLADLAGVVANPATAWTTGKFMVLVDASHAYWNGTAWIAGNAP